MSTNGGPPSAPSMSSSLTQNNGGGGVGELEMTEGAGLGTANVADGGIQVRIRVEEGDGLPSLLGASPRKKAKTQKRKAVTSGEELELLELGREHFASLDADRQWDLFSELLSHVKSLTKDVEEMKSSHKQLMERNNVLTAAAAHTPPLQPASTAASPPAPPKKPTYAAIAQAHLDKIPVHDRERAQSLLNELRPVPGPRRPPPSESSPPALSADKLQPVYVKLRWSAYRKIRETFRALQIRLVNIAHLSWVGRDTLEILMDQSYVQTFLDIMTSSKVIVVSNYDPSKPHNPEAPQDVVDRIRKDWLSRLRRITQKDSTASMATKEYFAHLRLDGSETLIDNPVDNEMDVDARLAADSPQ
ncbi:hypothetical protein BT69DRAFT_1344337 [Atractiella rhizophila]|nr:hypothetical protein BT69DRAFT_1344337 [Atractiella rhizophila]